MPGAARLADICTGHCTPTPVTDINGNTTIKMCCFPPRTALEGSSDTYVNNRPLHCVTHKWNVHCSPCGCHPGTLSSGCETVICNWLNVGRCGDNISCGSKVATCSSDVIIGDI